MEPSHRNRTDASPESRKDAEIPPPRRAHDALLEALPLAAFTLLPDRTIRTINAAAARLLGYPAGQAVGRRCDEILRCRFHGSACAACEAQVDQRTHGECPVEVARADGERRSLLIDAVPLDGDEVAVLLRDVTEAERLRRDDRTRWEFHGMVGAGERMREVIAKLRSVAPYDSTVLILGESGTGKEMVARAIHAESPRARKPFVVVNCAAYPETLLESELFGHVKGSFTGADRDRRGRFEVAEGGTVLLDEAGEMSPQVQVKLLRVLQQREIERVGESRTRPIDIRILAATHRDLARRVAEGRFREDLYYRLNVFALSLPPLRERREDIPVLVDAILARVRERIGKTVRAVSPEVLATLMEHAWPGNIRELENVIESAVVTSRGDLLTEVDLPPALRPPVAPAPEQEMRAALERAAGCVTRAARLLGLHRTTLWRHMRELGIRRDEFLIG